MELDILGRKKDESVFDNYFTSLHSVEDEKPSRVSKASRNYDRRTYNPGQTGELDNINRGISPYKENNGRVSPKDAIDLMQKAYYNVASVRSAIDMLSDLANSRIRFIGKNKGAIKFFTKWEKRIGGWDFRGRFFREFWRSCNVFIYRHLGELTYSDVRKMSRAASKKEIPIRYTILNPVDIQANGCASFVDATYSKVLNDYEVKRLQSPNQTEEEKEFVKSLSPEEQKKLKSGGRPEFILKPDKVVAVFNGKQDYEPMATPCFSSVLQDINFKIELRKSEMILARTADRVILLITAGEKEREHSMNSKLINGLTQAFAQDSIGRVLVSDYTTKAEFVIPDLDKVFGEGKYKSINEDIANGLMNIFWKDESFSSSMIKIQIFLERLKTARETYVDLFLRPEMEKIAETLGFQDVSDIKIEWEDFNLKDDLEYKKLYTRLCELGILTADETVHAFETHQLPVKEDSVENQKEYKKFRDDDLYLPLVGGTKEETTAPGGRPPGSKAPKKKIKVSPVGAEEGFSLAKISDNIKMVNSIALTIEAAYKEKNKMTRLSKRHKDICTNICESLIINESSDKWEEKIAEYLVSAPFEGEKTDENYYLASQHSVDPIIGAILNNSKVLRNTETV